MSGDITMLVSSSVSSGTCRIVTSPSVSLLSGNASLGGPLNLATAVAARADGMSRVSIQSGDACHCAGRPGCTYSATIVAPGASVSTVMAAEDPSGVTPDSFTLLADGVPSDARVTANADAAAPATQYFDFAFVPAALRSQANSSSPMLTVTLTQYSGPMLRVFALVTPETSASIPSDSLSLARAQVIDGVASLTFDPSDSLFVAACGNAASMLTCRLRLAVVLAAGSNRASRLLQASMSASPSVSASALPGASASSSASPSVSPSSTPAPLLTASYTVLVRSDMPSLLADSVPALGQVGVGSSVLFRFIHAVPSAALVLSLTPLSGKVNMFVGCSGVPASLTPSPTNFIWRSLDGVAVNSSTNIVISPLDVNALNCPGPCTYVIAVTPSNTSSGVVAFTLLARTRLGIPVPLLDGQPLNDVVLDTDASSYSVPMPINGNLNATLVFLLRLNNPLQRGVAPNLQLVARVDGNVLSRWGAQYRTPVLSMDGSETQVLLRRSDPAIMAACPPRTRAVCPVQVQVVANASASFTLTAVAGNRQLQDGVAAFGTLPAGAAAYFVYVASSGASHVSLSLTTLSGAARMVVSRSIAMPTVDNADIVSDPLSDTISLSASPDACARSGSSLCVFYIAVITGGVPASFRVLAVSSVLSMLQLGQPTSGTLQGNSDPMYYAVYVPAGVTTGVEVVVDVVSGGYITLAASTDVGPTGAPTIPILRCPGTTQNCPNPVFSPAIRNLYGLETRARLYVSANDTAFQADTTWVVALRASLNTAYRITVNLVGDITTLATGLATHDALAMGDAPLYYRVVVAAGARSVRIQAMPQVGTVRMFVGYSRGINSARPTEATADAIAGALENYGVVLGEFGLNVCPRDEITGECTIYISIARSGETNAAFSLLATVDGGMAVPTRLQLGVPLLDSTAGSMAQFYTARVNLSTNATIVVTLVEQFGAASLYASTDGSIPTNTRYGIMATYSFAGLTIRIPPSSPLYIRQGVLGIAVYGTGSAVRYQLTYSVSSGVVEVSDGSTVDGTSDVNTPSYFSLTVGADPGDLIASLVQLDGRSIVVASKWQNPEVNTNFRPTNAPGGAEFASTAESTLVVEATSPRACTSCTYIFAVICSGTDTCDFALTLSTSKGSLTALSDSLPVRLTAPQGRYRYFTFQVPRGPFNVTFTLAADSGAARMFVTDTYIPGESSVAMLPNASRPNTFKFSSTPDQTDLLVTQNEPLPVVFGGRIPVGAALLRLYTIGVLTTARTFAGQISATSSQSPTLLIPGVPTSNHPAAYGVTLLFAVEVRDPTRDLTVSVTTLRGAVVVAMGARGQMPACAIAPGRVGGPGVPTCSGTTWQVVSRLGGGEIAVPARRPCNSTAVLATSGCDPATAWGRGVYIIAVTGLDPSQTVFTLRATNGVATLRLLNGQPLMVTQFSGSSSQIMQFSTLPESTNPSIRFYWEAVSTGSGFMYYINSCVDDRCTVTQERPGPGNAALTGRVESGSKAEIMIPAAHPAYCRGNADIGDVCSYFISIAPDANYCTRRSISPCFATASVTATQLGSATIVLAYTSVQNKVTTLVNAATPSDVTRYKIFLEPDPSATTDVFMQLDACDMSAGYLAAYFCEDTPDPARNLTLCNNTNLPSSTDLNYAVNTSPETAGGDGRARLAVTTYAQAMTSSVMVPVGRSDFDAVRARFGSSNYELSLTVGDAAFMMPPTPDAVGDAIMATPAAPTMADIAWRAPLFVRGARSALAPNTSNVAVNVTYTVYVAPVSFAALAASASNTSLGFAGIVPTTACGLERWASIVARNVTPVVTTANSIRVYNVVPGMPYEVNVVAFCDDDCVRANAALYAYDVEQSALSAQRMPYRVVTFRTVPAPPVVIAEQDRTPNATSSTLIPLGFIVLVILVGAVYYVARRHGQGQSQQMQKFKDMAAATLSAMSPRAVTINRDNADTAFKPKTPALRRALVSTTSSVTQSTEDVEQVNIAHTLASRLEVGATRTVTPVATRPVPVATAPVEVPRATAPASAVVPVAAPAPAPAAVRRPSGTSTVQLPAGSTLPAREEEDVAVPRGPGRAAARPRVAAAPAEATASTAAAPASAAAGDDWDTSFA